MARLSFRCDEELVAAVDRARGDVARERWLRKAVEAAVVETRVDATLRELKEPGLSDQEREVFAKVPPGSTAVVPVHRRREKPSGCHEHPTAGRVENRGQWWCAEPGCMRSVV